MIQDRKATKKLFFPWTKDKANKQLRFKFHSSLLGETQGEAFALSLHSQQAQGQITHNNKLKDKILDTRQAITYMHVRNVTYILVVIVVAHTTAKK